jgi:hypothetical protein
MSHVVALTNSTAIIKAVTAALPVKSFFIRVIATPPIDIHFFSAFNFLDAVNDKKVSSMAFFCLYNDLR